MGKNISNKNQKQDSKNAVMKSMKVKAQPKAEPKNKVQPKAEPKNKVQPRAEPKSKAMKLQPMKAMKLQLMKAMKVQKKQGKLTKKDLENLPQGELSLEEKIQTFKKSANPDMAVFLDSLSPAQRQVLWKRFEYARQEEPEAQSAWTTACRGAGSTQIKQDLLALYLKSDSANKKSQMWFRKLVEHAHVTGSKTTTVWEPFAAIKAHYGIQELMRRVARGTILCRRASDDKAEWEFRKITKEEYETEEVKQQTTGQKQ